MNFGLPENTIEIICNVLATCEKADSVLLFGSRALGTHRKGSDIDLVIKGDHILYDDILTLGVQLEELNLPYQIDLINYNTIKEPALKEHIDRVGIEIYSRSGSSLTMAAR
jgi:predicted nucleotidyltransferase